MAECPESMIGELVHCAVCLDVFKQPKLLACSHAFCMDCINGLPVDRNHKIYCPTCREPTKLPRNNSTASLRPAFLVNSLKDLYTKGSANEATSKPKHIKCPTHDQKLEMYCNDCQQMLCTRCAHIGHRTHNYSSILDTLSQQQRVISDAVHNLDTLAEDVVSQGESLKKEIDALIGQLIRTIRQSGGGLKQTVDRLVKQNLESISEQKQDGETFLRQLKSNEKYVQDKLHHGTQEEEFLRIQQEKREMTERLKAANACQDLALQQLQHFKEKVELVLQQSNTTAEACNNIGKVSMTTKAVPVSPTVSSSTSSMCYRKYRYMSERFKELPRNGIVGRKRTIEITVPDISWLGYMLLSCDLTIGGRSIPCEIKHVTKNTYQISFTANDPGCHNIKVQVKGDHKACSPCTIDVLPCIEGLARPAGIATTTDGLLVVADLTSISVVDKRGCLVQKSDSKRGRRSMYYEYSELDFDDTHCNTGICITPDNCILVASNHAPHITKYTIDYDVVQNCNLMIGQAYLLSIAVSSSGHIYVCDAENNCIYVFDSNLNLCEIFGEKGSGPGQFNRPRGIVIDSQYTVYVCDSGNDRIQKLTCNGTYISEFKVSPNPQYIAIGNSTLYITTDTDVVVYTTGGKFVQNVDFERKANTSIGDIAVDGDTLYICTTNQFHDEIVKCHI